MFIHHHSVVIIFTLITANIIAISGSEELCNSNKKLYTEMGCTPLSTDNNGCVLAYDCDHISKRDKDKCYYNNNVYTTGEKLNEAEKKDVCLVACFCNGQHHDIAQFTCAHIECPSLFGSRLMPPCYYKYRLNQCCGTKYCPELKDVVRTCMHGGKEYREGEIFYDNDKKCVCTDSYDGTIKDEYCSNIRCAYELLHHNKLRDYRSAAVYFETVNGCPIQFISYNETGTPESVAPNEPSVKTLNRNNDDARYVCKFGPLQLTIGQQLQMSEAYRCVKCSCNVPPYLTCIQSRQCP